MTIAVDLGRKATKQTNKQKQTSSARIDDYQNRRYTKYCILKQGSNTKLSNNNLTTVLERTSAEVTDGLRAFYWRQIFALDSAVVKTQSC